MKAIGEQPVVGPSARNLGSRLEIDIPVQDGDVAPGTGGMSVSPNDPRNLPSHRRPPEFGGTGRDPVFRADTEELGSDLAFRADLENPNAHGFIEPARRMTFDEYQNALAATRAAWRRYDP